MGVWVSVQAFLEAQWCKREVKSQSRRDPTVHISRGFRPGNRVQIQQLLCPVTHEDEGSFAESQLQAFGWFEEGTSVLMHVNCSELSSLSRHHGWYLTSSGFIHSLCITTITGSERIAQRVAQLPPPL